MNRFKTIGILFLLLVLASCKPPSEDSTDVDTATIYAEIKVENSGSDYTSIKVDLKKEHSLGESIRLVDGEKLTARFKDQLIELREDEDLFDIDYEGNLLTEQETGVVEVVLERANGDRLVSTVDLPAWFDVLNPG